MSVAEEEARIIEAAINVRNNSEILDRAAMRYPRHLFSKLHDAIRARDQALLEAGNGDGQ